MSGLSSQPLTDLLNAASAGEPHAHEKLWTALYNELRAIAARQLVHEKRNTVNPTSLVHEVYLRLLSDASKQWDSPRHFYSAAARAMRRIRIEAARHRGAIKRGGGRQGAPLRGDVPIFDDDPAEILAVNEALSHLEAVDPRAAEVVEMRFFAGLTVNETAEALDVSPRTVQLRWKFARTWLHRELSRDDSRFSTGPSHDDG